MIEAMDINEIKKLIDEYCIENGFIKKEDAPQSESDLAQALIEADWLYSKRIERGRHYDYLFNIVKIQDKLIGYTFHESLNEYSESEIDWETVREYEKIKGKYVEKI